MSRAKSNAVFDRLREGKDPQGKILTQAWTDWVLEVGKNKTRVAALYVDAEFRAVYDPVLAAVDVRVKKKALIAFLSYVGALPELAVRVSTHDIRARMDWESI